MATLIRKSIWCLSGNHDYCRLPPKEHNCTCSCHDEPDLTNSDREG